MACMCRAPLGVVIISEGSASRQLIVYKKCMKAATAADANIQS